VAQIHRQIKNETELCDSDHKRTMKSYKPIGSIPSRVNNNLWPYSLKLEQINLVHQEVQLMMVK